MSDKRALFEQGREALQRGLKARAEGQMQEAIVAYQQALGLFEDSGQTNAVIATLNNLGAVLQTVGQRDAAANIYRDALARAEQTQDTARMALSCGNLGALHLDSGDLVRAQILTQRALELYNKVQNPGGRANQLGNLGLIAAARGDLSQARQHMGEAAAAFLVSGNPVGAGRTLLSFGDFARRQGDNQEAAAAFERARDVLGRAGDRIGVANALRGLGQLAMRAGQMQIASQLIQEGSALHEAMNDARGQSACQLDLGNILSRSGALKDAMDAQMKAVELARQAGVREALASGLLALASTHLEMGDLESAGRNLQQAKTLFEALETPQGLASALALHARVALLRGHLDGPDGADDALNQAHKVATDGDFAPLLATIEGIRAGAAIRRGLHQQARDLLQRAQELHQQVDAAAGIHTAALAMLEQDALADPDAGLEALLSDARLTQARKAFEDSGDASGLMNVQRLEATLQRTHGDPTAAVAAFEALVVPSKAAGRRLDHIVHAMLSAQASLQTPNPSRAEPIAALANQARELGALPCAIRCGLTAARAHLEAQEQDAAAAQLQTWRQALEELPGPCADAEAMALDVEARMALSAEGQDAQGILEAALDAHRSLGDEVAARWLATFASAHAPAAPKDPA